MGIRSRILVGLAKAGFDQRFALARATKIWPMGWLVNRLLFEDDRMIYLPKDSAVGDAAERTISVVTDIPLEWTNTVLPSQVLDHFIRASKHHFIMDTCLCRVASDCKDYPKDLGCLFIGKGALKIDKRFGRLVTQDEALAHVRKCREKGLVHLIGRNKIDAVVFDTGRKEDLMSICSCCPCCCLWRMLPDLSKEIADGITKMPGVAVAVTDSCTGCGECVEEEVCFVGALSLADGRAQIDQARCRGCGRCVESCPNGAIELRMEDTASIRKAVEAIEPLVDIRAE